MLTILRQLEAFIAGMSDADRRQAIASLKGLFASLAPYPMPFTAGAILKVCGSAGVAHAAGTMDRWWVNVCTEAQGVGPNVASIFSVQAH